MIKRKSEQTTEVREKMRGGAGQIFMNHYLTKDEISAKCRLCARLVVPPGAGIGMHEHTGEDEIFIIHEGRGVVNDSGKESEVSAGDVIITGKGESHALRNNGDKDLVLTAIIMQY